MADNGGSGGAAEDQRLRRLVESELRQVRADLARLEKAVTAGPPWWTSYLFAVLFAMVSGWIGLVHRGNHTNSVEIARVASVQWQNLHIAQDIEDVKRRLATSEAFAARIPYLENQLKDFGAKMDGQGRDFGIKLDRLFEQRRHPE